MRPVTPFTALLAGASCFIAGLGVAEAFRTPTWFRADLSLLAGAAMLLLAGGVELRALYRAAAAAAGRAPRADAAA